MILVVCLAFVMKLANPDRDFGVSLRSGSTITAAPALSQYCAEHRATDLYILGVDDEFYSAALPLHHVHYGWIDASDVVQREHPHLAYLGILIPAAELPQLDTKSALYRDRLQAWGLDSTRAIATGLLQIIHDHPENDFLVSRLILPDPEQDSSHRVAFSNAEFTLLQSKGQVAQGPADWSCAM
jgi:hypothetical protein